ncbi:MAG: uroporphyrinogen decarboxylase family protein, partial [Limnochordia bacterium]|nr:uroporphyrinogen decarboxylase family protein [Limnochordia bacterium]
MDQKENALQTIKFCHPHRVACGIPMHRISYLGADHQGYCGGGHHLPVGSKWTDIWGTVWHREHEDVMGFPRGNPLCNLVEALEDYPWPDPDDERICAPIYEHAKNWNSRETFLTGSHRDTLWEKSYMLVGMENMMCYFLTEPNAVRELLHRIMNFQLGIAKHYLTNGVQIVTMSDDLGTQDRLLLSPGIIRDFLVPEYQRLFRLYKEHDVMIFFHSCGHITSIVDVFLDLGVDILDPIQATANDLDELRRLTAGRIALHGGVRSDTIVRGPIA